MIASLSFFIIISPRRAKVNSCAENFSEEKRSSCVCVLRGGQKSIAVPKIFPKKSAPRARCVLRGGQNFPECRLLSVPNGFWLHFCQK
ncbi:MAG TPA: hypothetical protein H9851_07450 [Candidatus Borkfalkia faecavium]|uniref:Uncharacterized protein n=1 Tax=Candidatus Borkfalkia faecavium TaxID=2838508 RepID=A0A9D1W1K2_9FIRM|nr:hypothetical protein [Candidatus Borkfalkia faecavium]